MKKIKILLSLLTTVAAVSAFAAQEAETKTSIDRYALVNRHNVVLAAMNPQVIPQVGNGEIAFGIDPTGLQTFYGNTMSQWGWHSSPYPAAKNEEEKFHPHSLLKLQDHDFYGRNLPYRTSGKDQSPLFNWMRENPHRLNLGRLRFLITKKDGNLIEQKDVQKIYQTLNLWEGVIESSYEIEGTPVHVQTCVAPSTGTLAVKVESPLIKEGRLQIEWSFPYGSPGNSGADWNQPEKHKTTIQKQILSLLTLKRQLDNDVYYAAMIWLPNATIAETAPHTFVLTPKNSNTAFEFSAGYSSKEETLEVALFPNAVAESKTHWQKFWTTGGAVDLSQSKDERWKELERRIVLSQYLLAVNEAGSLPPQESGLYNNSGWYGKFHLEMHFWHEAHYALWGRLHLFEPSLKYYRDALPKAKELAKSQGFKGARFVKMSGPDNEDSPSGTGPYLIWQQPHPIFYAELEYRLNPSKDVLEKWKDVIQEDATFMADFAQYDTKTDRYILGPPLSTVPENSNYRQTWNPSFELCYWRVGLRLAQTWRERLGLPREKHWDDVLQKLSKLPEADGVYLSQENMLDTYTKMNWEHPSLVGPHGVLPPDGVDFPTAKRTLEKVWNEWQLNRCWGWDFPMIAMSAAKNGRPDIAVDALLHQSGKNGMNQLGLSTGGPYPYFPSNGGLLYAVAMMCAGWDGCEIPSPAPGFPQDGTWTVKWEGLVKTP